MIDRYISTDMLEAWSLRGRYYHLLDAAVLAARVTDAELSLDGELAASVLSARHRLRASDTSFRRWQKLEADFGHDIAAFVEVVREQLDPPVAQYFHIGRTSSDLTDTAMGFAIRDSLALVGAARDELLRNLARRALVHAEDPIVARTHGQAAELISVGRRFAQLAYVISEASLPDYRVGKLTGPVGTRSSTLAAEVLVEIGFRSPRSTQIVPRWYLADAVSRLAAATVPISDLAVLIRLGSRDGDSGPSWCREGTVGSEARGSSAMPTKRNPVRSERASGLCVRIRAGAASVVEAVSGLWEERDISHSSVERVALPELFALLEFVYRDMAEVVRDLDVRVPEVPESTPAATLEALVVHQGLTYTDAYRAIQGGATVPGALSVYDPGSEPGLWALIDQIAGNA